MDKLRNQVKMELRTGDLHFKEHFDQHRELDEEAFRLGNQTLLTPKEESHLKEIKRKKLYLKDQMEHQVLEAIKKKIRS